MVATEFNPQKIYVNEDGTIGNFYYCHILIFKIEYLKTNRPIKIYADGVFDLFHIGHAKLFEQIKEIFPNSILYAAVVKDEDTFKYKGAYPVMNYRERCAVVQSCRHIDKFIMNPPFYPTIEFIDNLNIDIVAHDGIPYPVDGMEDSYKPFKDANRFLPTQREDFISTTDIVKRILNNYESLVKLKKFQNI
uniref:choline-phosphate cytidylyltransferase n=1 Tax=Strongyloides papillosus TaxID=174720 RepID=A0A0N5BVB5_STREA